MSIMSALIHPAAASVSFPFELFLIIPMAIGITLLYFIVYNKGKSNQMDPKRDKTKLVPDENRTNTATALNAALFFVPIPAGQGIEAGKVYLSPKAAELLADDSTADPPPLSCGSFQINIARIRGGINSAGYTPLKDLPKAEPVKNAIQCYLDEASARKAAPTAPLVAVTYEDLVEYVTKCGKMKLPTLRCRYDDKTFSVDPVVIEQFLEVYRNIPKKGKRLPISIDADSGKIMIDTDAYAKTVNLEGAMASRNSDRRMYEIRDIIPLTQKTPVLHLYVDDKYVCAYTLETEGEEDFSGKYFHICLRLSMMGNAPMWAMTLQTDGFVSDTPEERKMKSSDIGYRMEGCILGTGKAAEAFRARTKGADLVQKGLKYPGMTTPSNVRLIGVCSECGQSFAFRGYALYMAQQDVAYSDDGLDVCAIEEYDIDRLKWARKADGKVFRYYNSFCCPHCGKPYIDYAAHSEMKKFGVSACTLIGRKVYHSSEMEEYDLAAEKAEQEKAEQKKADAAETPQTANAGESQTRTAEAAQPAAQSPGGKAAPAADDDMIDDVTYIKELHHVMTGVWHEYDVILNARGYGWEMILSWADYLKKTDLSHISTVTVAAIAGAADKELIDEYRSSGEDFAKMSILQSEWGVFAIGGVSKAVGAPVKCVWYNQTKVLRFFTLTADEDLMTRYIETMIRRSFGTSDAMKRAKPDPVQG